MELNLKEHTKKYLQKYAKIAQRILKDGTQYQSNKEVINALFKKRSNKEDKHHRRTLRTRIIAIDSCYSTGIKFNLYGIDDLVNTLAEYSDDELIKLSQKFLDNPSEKGVVKSLIFENKYGIYKSKKEGEKEGRKEKSFVSKYLYFLNKGNFPIYDKFVKYSFDLLNKMGEYKKIGENNFFGYMKSLKHKTKIEKYGTLDNLLWLMGKLRTGSFSFMKKEDYKEITEGLDLKKDEDKGDIIMPRIEKKYDNRKRDFFKFVFDL